MKRLSLFFTFLTFTAVSFAQSLPSSGFYRVMNENSKRYITVIDNHGKIDYTGAQADMDALRSFPIERTVDNLASVIYMNSQGGSSYDLQGQGTGAMAIVGYPLQIRQNSDDGTYYAYATKSGATIYLYEKKDPVSNKHPFGIFGKLATKAFEADNATLKFRILPLSASNDNNYLGLKADVNAGGTWYKSVYSGFAFNTVSSGMSTYFVTKVDKAKGVAVYSEINGTVPAATPCFVKCTSSEPSTNRLDFVYNSPQPVNGNLLTGVYFCNTPNETGMTEHHNFVTYNEATMRVLGTTSSGELGFVKAPANLLYIGYKDNVKYIPANTSYLVVDADAPAELKLVTKEEYEAGASVTVTAKSYTITYGDPIPTFEFEASSALTGTPSLTCDATSSSPVGTYTIKVGQGSVTGATVNGVAGILTINPAVLTVTAQPASCEYGDAIPQLSMSYTGWKNGENEAVLTTKPSLTCLATSDSDAGQYDITVAGAATQNYTFNYVPSKLTIRQAPVVVTAKSYEITQADPLPAFEATYSGWKKGQNESVLLMQPSFICNAPANVPGVYDIIVSGAQAKNYSFTYVAGKLTVTAIEAITITASDAYMVYGDAVPEFTYTVTGGNITGTPVITCEASSTSDVGEYVIKIEKGTVDYANLVLVNGVLKVTAAPVVVKAKSYTIVETEALPAFEAEYSGWKNGQSESVLTKKPTFSCDALTNKVPGEYDITVGGAEAKNYSFTYTAGKLTITQAPTITVRAEAKEMVYGDAVPQLTYTVEGGTLTGTPEISTVATSKSDVGDYDITIAKGSIDYPRLVLQGAKLKVKKATVTVSAGTYTMKQNDPRPTFKATYAGWKNDDTEAVLTKQPTFSTSAPDNNAPGEYTVTVSGAEAKNYDFTYVSGKLVISAADAITIVAIDATMVYGDAVPEFKYTVTGGTVSGTPVLTCEASSTSDVGEYVIKIEKGTIDYENLVLVNGKLTISPAKLTVTAEDACREYGDENPELKVKYSGWKNNDSEASLTKKPVAATDATKNSDAGTAVITVAGAEAKNYIFDYVTGTLTIEKAVLTVKAENAEREEGKPNPEFVLTYAGWKNDDTEAVLVSKPVADTEADENSAPGTYAITVSGGEAKNYTFKYVSGILTVTKDDAIVSLLSQGKAFDVYTVSGLKVRSNVTTFQGLPSGIYMVNGKKVLVK